MLFPAAALARGTPRRTSTPTTVFTAHIEGDAEASLRGRLGVSPRTTTPSDPHARRNRDRNWSCDHWESPWPLGPPLEMQVAPLLWGRPQPASRLQSTLFAAPSSFSP